MSVNPLRKILWKIGLDVHRYRPIVDHFSWLGKAGVKTVLDIGANKGQFIDEIRPILPDAFIYSFEPLSDCYKELVDLHKDDKKFKAFNIALGDLNNTTTIHRSSYSLSSSIRKMAQLHKDLYPHTKGESEEMISVRRLDDVEEIKSNLLAKNILIKIDTQGYEDKVISGGKEFLKDVRFMIIETAFVSLYEGQPLFADIYRILISQGFSYKGGLSWKFDSKNGGAISEDSLFIRG